MGHTESNFTIDNIRSELHRILSCEALKSSTILSQFLEFVVEEKLAGRAEGIKEYTIGIKVLHRSADFNPQADAAVRIHAGRLRRILHEYYYAVGASDPIVISIPKGTYIPEFNIPSELPTQGPDAKPAKRVEGSKPVLMVLPFQNLSADHSLDYFIAGIGEQLCNDLVRFQHISVLSYYSVWEYAHRAVNSEGVSRIPRADYVLSGSTRFIDDRVRLNVQLSETETGIIVWAETYEQTLTIANLYEVQDEIVNRILGLVADENGIVASITNASAAPLERTGIRSVYEAMSLFYVYQKEYSSDTYHSAFDALTHAVKAEPENALVLAMYSKMHLDLYAVAADSPVRLLETGMEYAQRAVQLNSNCQHAYQSLAWAYLLLGEKEKCHQYIDKCILLNPKAATITGNLGFGLICLGLYAEGFELLLKALQLSPNLPWCSKMGFSLYYYYKKSFNDSFEWLSKITTPEIPFISILRIASQNKMAGGVPEDATPSNLFYDHIPEIVGRFILDDAFKTEILEGARVAGLTNQ